MHYSLAPARGAFHEKLLDCLANCFHDVPDLAKDQARLHKRTSGKSCCR